MNRHPVLTAIWVLFFLFLLSGQILAQEDLPKLVKKILPAVVTIIAYNAQGKVTRQGSGFFISPSGDFITNYHVLTGATRAEVRTREGRRYPITKVLAQDRTGDLLVAAIEPPLANLPSLKISGVLPEVGEKLLVVGSPFGLEQTLSDGVVSAVRRIPDFGTILQITAPISSGSSGSPVVNTKGEVIGVATFIFKEGQNLNFAVPGSRVLALQQRVGRPPVYPEAVKAVKPIEPTRRYWSLGEQATKLLEAGNLEKVIEIYKEMIRLQPDHRFAYYSLGSTYLNLGRYQEAVQAFKQVIRLSNSQNIKVHQYPQYQTLAHFNLGQAYIGLGDRGAALEEYKILKTHNPESGLVNLLFDKIYKASPSPAEPPR